MKTAAIIGGMDFLGCDITLKFLSEDYRVKIPVPHLPKRIKPIVQTGISANENLKICAVDRENYLELLGFLQDCDVLIHCGTPLKLGVSHNGIPIYIPLITGTGNLLKVIRENRSVEKVIFIASPSVFIDGFSNAVTDKVPKAIPLKGTFLRTAINRSFEKARYHAEKARESILENFSDTRFEVLVVSPVEVNGNRLTNSRDSTVSGLQYLFRNKIKHDPVFHQLLRRNVLQTMTDIHTISEQVFDAVTKKEQTE